MVQVGDVVLVDKDTPWPQSYAQGSQKLLGCEVYSYSGIPLGKVRLSPVQGTPWPSTGQQALQHAGCLS